MRSSLKLSLAAAAGLLIGLLPGPRGTAADQSVNGLTVSPALAKVDIQPGETQHRLEFTITNNRPTAQTLQLSAADFNSLEDTGGLVFVGSNPTQLQKKYGLAKWLSLAQTSLSLAPHQTVSLTADILNQPDLAAGGHYGALMLSLENGGPPAAGNQISLQPIASALIFVNKLGGDIHSLKLEKTSFSHSWLHLPTRVDLGFHNTGNTHVVPRGEVLLSDPGGRLIAKGIINTSSAIILPERQRTLSVSLRQLSLPNLPGHYHLNVNYHFDGFDQARSYQTSFLLLSPIGLLLAGLAVGLAGAVYGRATLVRIWQRRFGRPKAK